MSTRITPDHLGCAAVVYVRQSTMAQVMGNLESQRRQYDRKHPAKLSVTHKSAAVRRGRNRSHA
jgi:hypothetical protein